MTIRTLRVGLGVAWAATLAGLAWMMSIAGAGPEDVGFLLMYSDIVLKICAFLSVASTVVGVVTARPLAWIGFCAALAWGVLGGLYGAAYARSGLINMNPPIPFEIYAQGYAQALLVLLIGLTGAILTTLTGLRRPARTPPSRRANATPPPPATSRRDGGVSRRLHFIVIPAKAGTQRRARARERESAKLSHMQIAAPSPSVRSATVRRRWVPAFAGMTAVK